MNQDIISEVRIKNEIPKGVEVEVISGDNYDIDELKIEEAVPKTK